MASTFSRERNVAYPKKKESSSSCVPFLKGD
jgi:hypothetical protein